RGGFATYSASRVRNFWKVTERDFLRVCSNQERGKHQRNRLGDSEAARRLSAQRRPGAPRLYLGASGHREVLAGAAVRCAGGAALRLSAWQPARARRHTWRAADLGEHQPLLPSTYDRARGTLLPVPRRAERLLT